MAFGKKNKRANESDNTQPDDDQFFDLVFDVKSGAMSLVDEQDNDAVESVSADELPENADKSETEVPDEAETKTDEEPAGEAETEEAGTEDDPDANAVLDEVIDPNEFEEPEQPAAEDDGGEASEADDEDASEDIVVNGEAADTEGSEPVTEEVGNDEEYEEAASVETRRRSGGIYGEDDGSVEEENYDLSKADQGGEDTEKAVKTPEKKEEAKPAQKKNDKVKSEKLDDLVNEKTAGGSDYAADKLIGLLGVSRSSNTSYDTIAGLKLSVWGIIVLAIFLVDTVLFNFVAYKLVYPLVDAVMKMVGVEGLRLDRTGTENLYTIISYAVAFIFCGLVVMVICKLAEILMNQLGMKNSSSLVTRTLLVLMIVFVIIGLIVMIVNHAGLLTLVAYRWICPFLGYAGGLVFFLFTLIGRKKTA
ncbi:MAG: hypothetical protein K6G89_02600 [Clostridia bacterium]|nr:hypothetical protein [Clostridia bacterium]